MIVAFPFIASGLTFDLRAVIGSLNDEYLFRPRAAHVSALLWTSVEAHFARNICCRYTVLILFKPLSVSGRLRTVLLTFSNDFLIPVLYFRF